MAIIGISGKKQSGKDTVGRIIQIITNSPHFNDEAVVEFINKPAINPKFEVKKFADKLKDIHCLLFGCTREQLEDEDFKNTELGEEWWYWVIVNHYSNDKIISPLFSTQKEAKQWEQVQPEYEDTGGYDTCCKLIKPTHRLFLQLLGTQAGRQIIHPNIWVNATMSEYKPKIPVIRRSRITALGAKLALDNSIINPTYPNWIITDVRFPNEVKAIEDKQGITIRVNRLRIAIVELASGKKRVANLNEYPKEHESETALDDYGKWNYVINNDGTLLELVQKVREILIKTNTI